MPKFAANLSMMFQDLAFLDRFSAAASAGFKGVEFLFPYDHPAEEVAKAATDAGVEVALFNLPPGDWTKGERGFAAMPGRQNDFDEALNKAMFYAEALGCNRLHCMAGLVTENMDLAEARATYISNLTKAGDKLASSGRMALIEPINTRDVPGYFINYQQDAHDILSNVKRANVKVQMDFYHVQIMEGDLAMRAQQYIGPNVGHIQIAGVPERHEPDIGEINYPYVFALLDKLGYDGWIGCEYRPEGDTLNGIRRWGAPYGLG